LEQALGNLLDNALRYGEGPVELEALSRNGSVELHVRDRGVGLSKEFRERAFERFSRAEISRSQGGSGLGLASSRRSPKRTAAKRTLRTAPAVAPTLGWHFRLPAGRSLSFSL
jgi:C4-dicarboxylate-specific signal transduction histidine kinase